MKKNHQIPKGVFAVLFYLFFSTASIQAQCFATSWQNATSFTTDNSIGQYDFSTPTNAQNSDNTRSSASALISILTGDTYYLMATGFNFNIPWYASICGVTVEIESRATGLLLTAAVRDNEVRLIKNGSITGSNYAAAGDWDNTDSYKQYGGASNLWGTTLTPTDVNAANFGVAISARLIALIAALPSAQIDHVRVRIDYNPVLPVTLLYFKAERAINSINLQWKTTEEEDGATITLQRSIDRGAWINVREYALQASNHDKEYAYNDMINEKGDRQYRLQVKLLSGELTYSATRFFTSVDKENILLYPNPAKDLVVTNGAETSVFDMMGKRWNLPAVKNGNTFNIRISSLPPGIYYIQNEKGVAKLIKE